MNATDRIIRVEQGTPEWWAAKVGKPSASQFDRIVTPGGSAARNATAQKYLCELLAERCYGGPPEGIEAWTSRAMQDGIDTEPEARATYALLRDVDVEQVGFCLSECGRFGCSPDGLVGDDGGLELKCPMLKTHIGYLLSGGLPAEYRLQVHGALAVTGRAWWDFVSYAPGGFPMHVVRVEPDEFTAQVAEALAVFCDGLDAAWERLQAMMPEAVVDEADTGPF